MLLDWKRLSASAGHSHRIARVSCWMRDAGIRANAVMLPDHSKGIGCIIAGMEEATGCA